MVLNFYHLLMKVLNQVTRKNFSRSSVILGIKADTETDIFGRKEVQVSQSKT